MSFAAPHPCPRCKRLVVGRCEECAKARKAERDKLRANATTRGYDRKWAAFSKRWLAKHRWCGMRIDGLRHAEHSLCVQRNVMRRATVTDHIVPLRDGGEKYNPDNLQSLCTACNTAKG